MKKRTMKQQLLLLLFALPFCLTAQTSVEEYNYLSKTYSEQLSRGESATKAGYYFQDLMNMIDNSGKIKLLYKNEQTSVVPLAIVVHVTGETKTHYICVPHEDSESEVFDLYADDLQQLFEQGELVRKNYSKIMLRYPKQIQKYYDEILALETGVTTTKNADSGNVITSNNSRIESESISSPARSVKTEIEETPSRSERRNNPEPIEDKIVLRKVEKGNPNTPAPKTTRKRGKSSAKIQSVLTRRKIENAPQVYNTSEATGNVRMDICVNAKGDIITVKHNKSGSTTRNPELIKAAQKLAKQYKFSKSHLSRQCGNVVFTFK